MKTCPECSGAGYVRDGGTIILCSLGCEIPGSKVLKFKGETSEQFEERVLGLKPCGQSIVRPRPLMGDPYDGKQS